MPEMILIRHDRLDRVQSMMKTKQDNNETETEMSGSIWLGAVCDENQIGQWCD